MSDPHEQFGLDLILAEEGAVQPAPQPQPQPQPQPDQDSMVPQTFVHDDQDVTVDGTYHVAPEDFGMEVPGPGTLDTLLLVADGEFSVHVETGNTTLLSEDFATLQTLAAEMSHVSAYEREDGSKMVAVGDFPFHGKLTARVQASNVTFERVRGVFTLGGEADY